LILIQDRFVEGWVKTIMESTEKILENPEDYEGRATMMWAATWPSTGWQRPVLAGIASQVT
jgi:alcohol dehydrogenase YqhD (iron-dependent ADH family)